MHSSPCCRQSELAASGAKIACQLCRHGNGRARDRTVTQRRSQPGPISLVSMPLLNQSESSVRCLQAFIGYPMSSQIDPGPAMIIRCQDHKGRERRGGRGRECMRRGRERGRRERERERVVVLQSAQAPSTLRGY